jgi:hypothetical protein
MNNLQLSPLWKNLRAASVGVARQALLAGCVVTFAGCTTLDPFPYEKEKPPKSADSPGVAATIGGVVAAGVVSALTGLGQSGYSFSP